MKGEDAALLLAIGAIGAFVLGINEVGIFLAFAASAVLLIVAWDARLGRRDARNRNRRK